MDIIALSRAQTIIFLLMPNNDRDTPHPPKAGEDAPVSQKRIETCAHALYFSVPSSNIFRKYLHPSPFCWAVVAIVVCLYLCRFNDLRDHCCRRRRFDGFVRFLPQVRVIGCVVDPRTGSVWESNVSIFRIAAVSYGVVLLAVDSQVVVASSLVQHTNFGPRKSCFYVSWYYSVVVLFILYYGYIVSRGGFRDLVPLCACI
mmetsp:Transcript_35177/g.81322  ORF Transcript_35177/g.81322 Transcript_35177/m.81322 type:complete len:201 (+) Transcript_35177:256-858(+)